MFSRVVAMNDTELRASICMGRDNGQRIGTDENKHMGMDDVLPRLKNYRASRHCLGPSKDERDGPLISAELVDKSNVHLSSQLQL